MTAVISKIRSHLPSSSALKPKMPKGLAGLAALSTPILAAVSAFSALSYKFDDKGNEVQGSNYDAFFKEWGGETIKFASYALPTVIIGGLTAGAPIVVGALAQLAATYCSFFEFPEFLSKLIPSQAEKIKEACKSKGIDYEPPSLLGNLMGGTLSA